MSEQKLVTMNKKGSLEHRLLGLYVNHSNESYEALQILRSSGFYVISLPVSYLPAPELEIDGHVFRGIKEIKKFAIEYKKGEFSNLVNSKI